MKKSAVIKIEISLHVKSKCFYISPERLKYTY